MALFQNSNKSFSMVLLSLLLKENGNFLRTLLYIFYIISQIQILAYSLFFSLNYLSLDQREYIGQSLIEILKGFILDPSLYLKSTHQRTFELLIFIMLIYTGVKLLNMLIVFILNARGLKVPQACGILLKVFQKLHVECIMIPTLSLQYSMIAYADDKTYINSEILSPNFLKRTGLVSLTLNILTSLSGSISNFDPWIHGNLLASRPSIIPLLDFLLKVQSFIGFGIKGGILSQWLTIYLQIILLVTKGVFLYNRNPYFHFKQSIIAFSFTMVCLGGCLINLALAYLDSNLPISSTYIWIMLCPAFLSLSFHFFRNRLYSTLEDPQANSNVYRSLQKYTAISQIFQSGSFSFKMNDRGINKDKYELHFSALVYTHRASCKNSDCFCALFDFVQNSEMTPPDLTQVESRLSSFMYEYVKNFLEQVIAKNSKGNIWLKISLIQHITKKRPEQSVVALSVLHSINRTKISYFEAFVVDTIIQSIQKNEVKRSRGEGEVDLASIVYYKDDIESFRKKLGAVSEMTASFWDTIQSGSIKIAHLVHLASKSNSEDDKLRIMWAKIIQRHSSFLFKDYLLYATYLSAIRNNDKEGRAIFKIFEKISLRQQNSQKHFDKITSKNLHDDKNLFITVNMSKKSLGTIRQAQGKGAPTILGWDNSELNGVHINMIIPTHFRERHDYNIMNHLDHGTTEKLQSNIFTYALRKNGYINPVYVYITMADNIAQELNYAAVIRAARTPEDFLLIWRDGKIVNSTERIASDLRVLKTGYQNNTIFEICPDFQTVFGIYKTINHLTKIKKFQNYHDLSFNKLKDYAEELREHKDFIYPRDQAHLDSMVDIYTMCTEDYVPLIFHPLLKKSMISNRIGYNCKITQDRRDSPDIFYLHLHRIQTKTVNEATPKNKGKRFDISKMGWHALSIEPQPEEDITASKASFVKPKSVKSYTSHNNSHGKVSDDSDFLSHASEGIYEEIQTPQVEEPILMEPRKIESKKATDSSQTTLQYIKNRIRETEFEQVNVDENFLEDSDAEVDEIQESKEGSDEVFYGLIKTGKIAASAGQGSQAQSVSSVTKGTISETDNIIGKPAKDARMKVLFIFLSLYFVLITVGFIIFTNISNGIVDTAASTSDIIRLSTLRVFNLIELDRRVRCSNLVARGFLPKIKSGRGVSDYSLFCLLKAEIHAKNLHNLTTSMASSVANLDSEALPEFRKIVTLKAMNEGDPNLNLTIDGAIASIISSVIRLLKVKQMTADNLDMQFVLNNALNDMLYASEQIPSALLKYTVDLIETVIKFLENIAVIAGVLTMILIVVSILVEKIYTKEKKMFLLGIIHLDEKSYIDHVAKIRNFIKLVKDSGIIPMHGHTYYVAKGNKKVKNSSRTSRIDFKGFEFSSYVRILSMTASLTVVLVILLIMLAIFRDFDAQFITANKNLIINDNMMIRYALTFGALYEYISENMTTTIRNQPITPVIIQELEFLQQNSDFFKIFYDDNQEITNQDVLAILNGNLCARYYALLSSPTLCPSMANGAGLRGLRSINSYLLATYDAMKLSYDFSAKTIEAQNASLNLNMLRESETIMGNNLQPPYLELDGILNAIVKTKLNDYKSKTTIINAIAIVIGLLIIGLVNKYVYKHVLKERYELKRILKLIPVSILMENGKLKTFLKNSSDYL